MKSKTYHLSGTLGSLYLNSFLYFIFYFFFKIIIISKEDCLVCHSNTKYMIIKDIVFFKDCHKTATRLPIGSEWLVVTNILFHIVKCNTRDLRISYDKEWGVFMILRVLVKLEGVLSNLQEDIWQTNRNTTSKIKKYLKKEARAGTSQKSKTLKNI